MKQSDFGKINLFCAFVLAGTSVVTARFVTGSLGIFTITAGSLGLLLIVLMPFYGRQVFLIVKSFHKNDWLIISLQALLGIFLFRLFLFSGLRYTSATEAGVLTGVTPAITTLLAIFFLKESLKKGTLAGIFCTISGIVLLQGLFNGQFDINHLWGNILILGAAVSESSFNIISRQYGRRLGESRLETLPPLIQTLIVSTIAFFLCLIPAFSEQPLTAILSIQIVQWLALFWYALGVTALAFIFFYAGVRRCDAYTTAAFSGLMPLTAMLLSIVILKETLDAMQWVGSALIIAGIFMIARTNSSSHAS